uniref:Uncharacterized protein n=1 Tax=Triticum urartu TaxID=4572 RepID=A0A8R7UVZ0_TRIUA
ERTSGSFADREKGRRRRRRGDPAQRPGDAGDTAADQLCAAFMADDVCPLPAVTNGCLSVFSSFCCLSSGTCIYILLPLPLSTHPFHSGDRISISMVLC